MFLNELKLYDICHSARDYHVNLSSAALNTCYKILNRVQHALNRTRNQVYTPLSREPIHPRSPTPSLSPSAKIHPHQSVYS